MKEVFEKQIQSAGLESTVRIERGVDQETLVGYYRKAFAFVLPCHVTSTGDRDGIPNVILEAMAMGLPIVSTQISGIPEAVIDQRTGLTVSPDNPDQLAGALDLILRNPEFAQAMGKRAREKASSTFDAREHAQSLVHQMKIALNEGRPVNEDADILDHEIMDKIQGGTRIC